MGGVDIERLTRSGELLAGKYRVERVLGQGGMGVVVAAHHVQLDERVAIKFLLPEALQRADLLARFEREARAAVKIKSEHVARVIDVGVLDTGSPYIVMEYLDGHDLAARLASGPISVPAAADFVLQACEAIVEAHALGIIHRDLKPANLFVSRGSDGLDAVKVLDFGISKASALGASPGPAMTSTQSMLGSPYYMSPEQMQSAKAVDARSDIWALGCILYESVAGRVPFEADGLPELVLKIATKAPPSLRSVRPDVPVAFEQVVLRCLEKDRARRFQHIGELAQALVPFAPERGRASADRITRVVLTSGLANAPPPRPSSPDLSPPMSTLPIKPATRLMSPPMGMPGVRQQPQSQPYQQTVPRHTTPIGPPVGTPPPGVPSSPPLATTNDSFGNTTNAPGGKNQRAMIAGVVAMGVVVLLAIFAIAVKTYTDHQHARALPSASVSAAASPPSASQPPPPPPPPPPEPEAIVDAGAVEDATPAISTGATQPVVTAVTSTRPPPKTSCDPPFTIDPVTKIKNWKKECF